MLNLILLALYILPILAVLFLERKTPPKPCSGCWSWCASPTWEIGRAHV